MMSGIPISLPFCRASIANHTTSAGKSNAGYAGHPLLLSRHILTELPHYPTLRDLLQLSQELITLCPTGDQAILLDMDTP